MLVGADVSIGTPVLLFTANAEVETGGTVALVGLETTAPEVGMLMVAVAVAVEVLEALEDRGSAGTISI